VFFSQKILLGLAALLGPAPRPNPTLLGPADQQGPITLGHVSSFIKLASYSVMRAFICVLRAIFVIVLGIDALSLS